MPTAYDQYRELANRFNLELAGRYPFGELSSIDARLEATQSFFIDYTEHAEALKTSLAASKDPRATVALKFLAQLDKVSNFLRNFLSADGVNQPVKVVASFRALPEKSKGSDQILSWVLSSGADSAGDPNRGQSLDWTSGQALRLDLRWAAESEWRPSISADRVDAGVRVDGRTMTVFARGQWALMRLVDRWRPQHVARFDSMDPNRVMLEFNVPVMRISNARGGIGSASEARIYLGLNLTRSNPRTESAVAVAWPNAFPWRAPLQ